MKKVLLIGLVSSLFSLYSYSQSDGLLITENFPYANGNLTGQGNSPAWASSPGTGDVQVTALTDNTGALVHPGYASGTSYVSTSNANTTDPFKGFIGSQTVSTSNATTFFMSFVVRVATGAGTTKTSDALPVVALRNNAGNNVCYFYVGNSGNDLKFGINKTESGSGDGSFESSKRSFDTTYLIVIRYDIVTGTNKDDKMYMWVNPSLVSEPTTASANESITNGADGNATGTIDALQLLENSTNGTTASVDAFKVAFATGQTTPSNSAIAWLDLSPAGAPLPLRFGGLMALQQSDGVSVDWSSYSEENVSYYEIERSSNGQLFSVIGQVAANGNLNGKTDYSWLDVSPINGNNYYRIKSVDIDGHVVYSSIIKINTAVSLNRSIGIYPSPVKKGSELTLQITNLERGDYSVLLFNRMGQKVGQLQINLANENMTQTLLLPSSIKPGTYNLVLTNGSLRLNKTFVVQ
jgi:hypothetical protein